MGKFVPDFILKNYKKNRLSGDFKAYALFIDISGFTNMTEVLMSHGKEGAEVLSSIINDIFEKSLKAVYINKGFVATFAGDSFTAIFQKKQGVYPLNSAFLIQRIFKEHGSFMTRFGKFKLYVKIGLSYGDIHYHIIGPGDLKTYYFRGEAIDNCARSEGKANNMQIIADKSFMEKISINVLKERIENDWYLISPESGLFPIPDKTLKKPSIADIESQFVPNCILEKKEEGEFRDIVSCFISFDESVKFNNALESIITACLGYGGYLNCIDFGDKGGNILIIFGAPVSMEKLYHRATDFILSLKDIPAFIFRAGLTTGKVFAGFTGSELRKGYAALGNVVNLSARLMMKAVWGQVLIDTDLVNYIKEDYNLKLTGSFNLKGFNKKREIWELGPKTKKEGQLSYSGRFIGRIEETKILKEFMSPVFEGKFGGLVYIDGPAGIGKSRFISNFKENMDNNLCDFIHLNCDDILIRPFNPFISFFKSYFDQHGPDKSSFTKIYTRLIDQTGNSDIKKELIRTESIIGAMIGLDWKDSLCSKLDAKDKYENTLYAVKNFFKAIIDVNNKPLIIIIEDCHWIDNNSLDILNVLFRNAGKCPFLVLAVCRLLDDGKKFNLTSNEEINIPIKRICLSALEKNNLAGLISDRLHTEKVPLETKKFILDKSEGNPFFAEQLTQYLIDYGLLDTEFNLMSEDISLPSGINQVILARIDRLPNSIKNIIKTASVIGREFELKILKELLHHLNMKMGTRALYDHMKTGEVQQMWVPLSEKRYIFRHALIREAVYDIQAKKNIRKIHDLAGNILEEMYFNEAEKVYEELADHFVKAENLAKALIYSEKSGDKAKDNFFNIKAVNYYNTALKFFDDLSIMKDKTRYIGIILKKAQVLQIIGKWNDAVKILRQGIDLAEGSAHIAGTARLMSNPLLIELKCSLSDILIDQGKYDQAMKLLKETMKQAKKMDYIEGYSNTLGHLGGLFYYMGDFEKAMEHYKENMNICEESGDKMGYAIAVGNLGSVYFNLGDLDKAMEHYNNEKIICEELGDKIGYADAVGNLGNIYHHRGDFISTKTFYQEKMNICEELGDRKGYSYTLGNIGVVYYDMGDYNKAMECFRQKQKICEELGDRRAYSLIIGNIGELYQEMGNFDKALEHFWEKHRICYELYNKRGIAGALSSIGSTYLQMGKYSESFEFYNKSKAIYHELEYKPGIITCITDIAFILQTMKDFDEAMKFYEEETNSLGKLDKDELLEITFNKAKLFYMSAKFERAKQLFYEALLLAEETGKKTIIFESRTNIHRIDKNISQLKSMLNKNNPDIEENAVLNYEIWKLTGDKEHGLVAQAAYRRLFEKTPKHEYKSKIKELTDIK